MPYIPKKHEMYDLLPNCKKYDFEIFIYDYNKLKNIQKLTNIPDMIINPYQRYKTYEEFFEELKNLIDEYPNYKNEFIEYKNSIIKMNNKDLWSIVQYTGETNFGFTKGKYYYVPMYIENNSWVFGGIIDNEEYCAGVSFNIPIKFDKDFKIIIDESNNLSKIFNDITTLSESSYKKI